MDRFAGREYGVVDDAARQRGFGKQLVEHGRRVGRGVEAHGGSPTATEQMFGIGAVYAHDAVLV
jgi:hypothetical protein